MAIRQMVVGYDTKDPVERLDWTEDWSDVLDPIQDQVKTFICVVTVYGEDEPTDELTIGGEQFTARDTTAFVEDGVLGRKYVVSHIIGTKDGRRFKRSHLVLIVRK